MFVLGSGQCSEYQLPSLHLSLLLYSDVQSPADASQRAGEYAKILAFREAEKKRLDYERRNSVKTLPYQLTKASMEVVSQFAEVMDKPVGLGNVAGVNAHLALVSAVAGYMHRDSIRLDTHQLLSSRKRVFISEPSGKMHVAYIDPVVLTKRDEDGNQRESLPRGILNDLQRIRDCLLGEVPVPVVEPRTRVSFAPTVLEPAVYMPPGMKEGDATGRVRHQSNSEIASLEKSEEASSHPCPPPVSILRQTQQAYGSSTLARDRSDAGSLTQTPQSQSVLSASGTSTARSFRGLREKLGKKTGQASLTPKMDGPSAEDIALREYIVKEQSRNLRPGDMVVSRH